MMGGQAASREGRWALLRPRGGKGARPAVGELQAAIQLNFLAPGSPVPGCCSTPGNSHLSGLPKRKELQPPLASLPQPACLPAVGVVKFTQMSNPDLPAAFNLPFPVLSSVKRGHCYCLLPRTCLNHSLPTCLCTPSGEVSGPQFPLVGGGM